MSNAESPMSNEQEMPEPVIDAWQEVSIPKPSEPRAIYAWLILWSLFGLLIIGQLAMYFAPTSEKETDQGSPEIVAELRSMMLQQRVLEFFSGRPDQETYARNVLKIKKNLTNGEKTQSEARMAVLIAKEVGQEPDPADLQLLEKSQNEDSLAFLELLRTGKTTKATDKLDSLERRMAIAYGSGLKAEAVRTEIYPNSIVRNVLLGFTTLIIALGTGLILLLYGGIRYAQGDWVPVGYPKQLLEKLQGDVLAMRMVLFFFLFILVPTIFSFLPRTIDSSMLTLIAMLVMLIVLVVSLSIPIAGQRLSLGSILGSTEGVAKKIGLGILGWMANLPIALGTAVLGVTLLKFLPPPSHPVVQDVAAANSLVQILTLFALTAVVVPILEELAFRGLLFPSFLPFLRPAAAMILSGFLFAAIHPQGPVLWLSLASVGAMAAFLTYQSGSLIPAMAMHAVHNFALLALNRLVS